MNQVTSWMVGHSEVILGPNFPMVTWTYSGVLGHVPVTGQRQRRGSLNFSGVLRFLVTHGPIDLGHFRGSAQGPTGVQNLAILWVFRVSHCYKGNRINGT